jgi:enolase-phosphatase E1
VSVRAIVTDIEGTTSSLAFVHDVLFPYARERLARFVRDNAARLAPELDAVRSVAGQPTLDTAGAIAELLAWHDADRKIAPLKTIQGMIWADGYRDGSLVGHVYPDAIAGLRRWHGQGVALHVYSSGSVAAQKLLFAHTAAGDLTPLFSGYFDTAVGGKRETASYRAIAERIGVPPAEILFLSDVAEELAAAEAAGMAVMLLVRGAAEPTDSRYPVARDFDTILAEKAAA